MGKRHGVPVLRAAQYLAVDGRQVCAVETPGTARERRQGLTGRDGITGALFLARCPAVHTVGMRFTIDVAFLDRHLVVVDMVTMVPGRLGWPRLRARSCVEAEAGSFARWGVTRGSRMELRYEEDS